MLDLARVENVLGQLAEFWSNNSPVHPGAEVVQEAMELLQDVRAELPGNAPQFVYRIERGREELERVGLVTAIDAVFALRAFMERHEGEPYRHVGTSTPYEAHCVTLSGISFVAKLDPKAVR